MRAPRQRPAAAPCLLAPLALALGLAGCGTGGAGPDGGVDAAVAAPDLAPTCLIVEPAPPAVDPDCPVVKPASADALDEALAAVGLDRCTFAMSTAGYAGVRDPYRLPWYDAAHDHPVNGPAFARTLVGRLDQAAATATPVANQLVLLGNRLAPATLTTCVPAAAVDSAQPLAQAVAALITQGGGAPDRVALEAAAAAVPRDLQAAVAEVVLAIAAANADWAALTAGLSSDDLDALAGTSGLVLPLAGPGTPNVNDRNVKTLLSKTWDEAALVAGAARLAGAVERASLGRFAGRAGFSFDVKTPLGRVVLHDAAADTYEEDDADAIALVVDTGGDDTYRAPVGAVGGSQRVEGVPIHVAVAVDLGGKDSWGYLESPIPLDTARDKATGPVQRLPSDDAGRYLRRAPTDDGPVSLSDQVRQGGARLGYGLLFDLGSDGDHYRALRMSQGFGCAGVGVLYDQGGDDTYEGEAGVQGAGIFGVGLLLDGGGRDTYRTYADAQGFAYVRAAGLLYDAGGDDQYLADTGIPALGGDPIYASPQTPCVPGNMTCGNSSFTQGVGFGRRAAGGADGANMSGGLGVLRDVRGDDVYVTSVFGQASGYWFGTGILADSAGADRYDGWWYTQGSAAHAALCVFLDEAGDDRYDVAFPANPPYATNTGQGHDMSIGWHLDLGGNDRYRAPGLGLGGGNDNGGGMLLNLGGDDVYEAPGGTILGGTRVDPGAGRQDTVPCYGLFLDVGGADTYTVPADPLLQPTPKDGATWHNDRNPPGLPGSKSIGVDRASGQVSLP